MGALSNGLDAAIAYLTANGWNNAEIRSFVHGKVVSHNNVANPNPHKITWLELNNYLSTKGISPQFPGNPNDPVT